MSVTEAAIPTHTLRRQLPAFVAVGAFGFVVDSSVTYALVRAGLDPLIARLPAFAVATVFNFALNRALTFAGTKAPLFGAFVRYCMVCGLGLAINWCAYALALTVAHRLGLPTPAYHHHPLLHDAEGRRLAKRDGARSLADLRAEGVDGPALADALRNGQIPAGNFAAKA